MFNVVGNTFGCCILNEIPEPTTRIWPYFGSYITKAQSLAQIKYLWPFRWRNRKAKQRESGDHPGFGFSGWWFIIKHRHNISIQSNNNHFNVHNFGKENHSFSFSHGEGEETGKYDLGQADGIPSFNLPRVS